MNPLPRIVCKQGNQYYDEASNCVYGYWYRDKFYRLRDSYTFSGVPGAVAVYESEGQLYQVPSDCQIGFLYGDEFSLCLRTFVPPQLHTPRAAKICNACKRRSDRFLEIFSKEICAECVRRKYANNELYSDTAEVRLEWSAEVIAVVHQKLKEWFPEDLLPEVPRLPLGTYICMGKDEPVAAGYPPKGHIIGQQNWVDEDGCPNGHRYCRTCAHDLTLCLVCQAFIRYESPPMRCQHCKQLCCCGFNRPCVHCQHTQVRRKVPQ